MLDEEGIVPVLRGRTLRQVAVLAFIAGAYALLAVWKENSPFKGVADIPAELHTALTLVLGCLLVFRTNVAYNRWWEARTLWGALVNASRNLAAKLTSLVEIPTDQLESAINVIVAFAYGLRDHLRDETPYDLDQTVAPEAANAEHVPAYLVNQLYAKLRSWKDEGRLDGDELRVVDRELARFLDICGGCERIRHTRLVRSYRAFARQCVVLFLLTLPWGLVDAFQWWTVPLTAITAYFMLGLEIVAEHVEEPFGRDEDDLALDQLCETIERTVREISRRC